MSKLYTIYMEMRNEASHMPNTISYCTNREFDCVQDKLKQIKNIFQFIL